MLLPHLLLLGSPGQRAVPDLPQNVQLLGVGMGVGMKFADPLLNSDEPVATDFSAKSGGFPSADDATYVPSKYEADTSLLPTPVHLSLTSDTYSGEQEAKQEAKEPPEPPQTSGAYQNAAMWKKEAPTCKWAGLPDVAEPMQCGVVWFLHIAKTGGRDIVTQLKGQSLGPLTHEDGGFVSARRLPANWTFIELWYDRGMGPSPMKSGQFKGTAAWKALQNTLREQEQPKIFVHDHNNMAGFDDRELFEKTLRPMACDLEARGCKLTLATMLREPNSRARSHVFFEGGVTHKNFGQRMQSISNYQTHYLLHNHNFHQIKKLKNEDLTRAWHYLQHFEVVGRTEDHDVFKEHMHTLLGLSDEANDESDNNRTPDSQKLQLTPDEEFTVRQSNLLDSELYNGLCRREDEPPRVVLPLCNR